MNMDVVGMPCIHDVKLSTMNIFDPLMPPEHGRWRMRCESRGDICEATIKPKKQRRRRDVILCHHLDEDLLYLQRWRAANRSRRARRGRRIAAARGGTGREASQGQDGGLVA